MKHKVKTILFIGLALIALFGMTACPNAAGGSNEGGSSGGGGNTGGLEWHEAPLIEGGASLILSPDKLTIRVTVTTSDNSPITVEGCDKTKLTSGTETVLRAKGTRVILKGKIIELDCKYNQLTALNVQGCAALQHLNCRDNKLTSLNVQGLNALNGLECKYNQLTALNVQGLTALKTLECNGNQLTELNVQGLNALQRLWCGDNQLTELNVQGLNALQSLGCRYNKLTELNVQGLNALQTLECNSNQLTTLNVQGLNALQELVCSSNQFTELNVQGLNALQRLRCYGNRLNADAFKKLFNDLPQRVDGDNAWCILYTEQTGVIEGNHTDFSTPSDLAAAFNNVKTVKKWKLYKWNGSGNSVEI